MRDNEKELITILKNSGVDFSSSLPCEKIKCLIEDVKRSLFHVPLTREEEGVGISAGAALAGKRPVMFVQSSGVGNMINALLSLTAFYELPLAVFVSRRGIHREKIQAQVPMGIKLPGILHGAGLGYSIISRRNDFGFIEKKLASVYKKNKIHFFLLNPAIFEDSRCRVLIKKSGNHRIRTLTLKKPAPAPCLTRFEILQTIEPFLAENLVVCNLGFPSKELFFIKHRPSNFYMLGSMGMATPIGLGAALASGKKVTVIDGDGSILMNTGVLATAAHFSPANLRIVVIDNGAYGSTGNQPTLSSSCVDLELIARGAGIRHAFSVSDRKKIKEVMGRQSRRLTFIHVLAVAGNRNVPPIRLHHIENKKLVQGFLKDNSRQRRPDF